MDTLQRHFESVLQEQIDFEAVALRVIEKKAAAKGIRLSRRDLRAIRQAVGRAGDREVRVPLRRWKWWERKELLIELVPEDFAGVLDGWRRLMENMPDLILDTADAVTSPIVDTLKRSWRRERHRQARDSRGFERRLQNLWGEPLDLYAMFLTCAIELGEQVSVAWQEERSKEEERLGECLFRLHARSCQVAREIETLLRHGFADGAMARWRTMHEIAVTASLLSDHGEELVEKYLLHEVVETWRSVQDYQRHCEVLGYQRFTETEVGEMEGRFRSAVARCGKSFGTPYGWAAELVQREKPTFRDLEDKCSLEHLRPYYRMAGLNVHATPKGMLFRLGLTDEPILLAGPSNVGLADPGQSAAISLMHVTVMLLQLSSTLDHIVAAKVLQELLNDVRVGFASVQAAIEEQAGTERGVAEEI